MERVRRRLGAVLAAVLLLTTLGSWAWMLHGGRWTIVETPSMGTRAPVGSLLRVSPVSLRDVRVGDLVTVRSRDSEQTWTHEVVSLSEDGRLRTAGTLTGPDAWLVDGEMLLGRVTTVWPGAGWLVRGTPVLVASAVGGALLLRRLPRRWRAEVATLVAAGAFCAVVLVHHPLQATQQMGFWTEDDGAHGEWVNTGLLPVRVAAVPDGETAVIGSGEVASLAVPTAGRDGRFMVRADPVVPWQVWAGIAGFSFLPAGVETLRHQRRARVTTRAACGRP